MRLGTGRFGAGLYLKNPCASCDRLRLSRKALLQFKNGLLALAREAGASLYPAPEGLVVIAQAERQIFLTRPSRDEKQLPGLLWWDLDFNLLREIGRPVSKFIYDLYKGLVREEWADELANYLWRSGREPFFTPWRRD